MTATEASVIESLVCEHGYTRSHACAVVARHAEIIAKGVRLGSYTYYVVGKVLSAEGHECGPQCKGDDDEGDE